jgi:hypothetical protein
MCGPPERVEKNAIHSPSGDQVSAQSVAGWSLTGKGGRRPGFLDEAGLSLFIGHELGWEHLQCDFPVELEVDRAVDDSHAAPANLFEDLVMERVRPTIMGDFSGQKLWPLAPQKSKGTFSSIL